MKKILITLLMITAINVFALEIHNPDGSTSYVTEDPSGAMRIDNPDGTTSFITDNGF